MRRILVLTGLVAVVLLVGGCGDDDDEAASGDGPERYCRIVAELEVEGERIFGSVDESDPMATARGEAELLAVIEEKGLVEAAPAAIRDDVAVFVDGVEARGTGAPYDEAAAGAAEQRVLAYEEENCPSGE